MKRNLNIVKRTPIALGFCEACKMEFNSNERVEDDAEKEIATAFAVHTCKPEGSAKKP